MWFPSFVPVTVLGLLLVGVTAGPVPGALQAGPAKSALKAALGRQHTAAPIISAPGHHSAATLVAHSTLAKVPANGATAAALAKGHAPHTEEPVDNAETGLAGVVPGRLRASAAAAGGAGQALKTTKLSAKAGAAVAVPTSRTSKVAVKSKASSAESKKELPISKKELKMPQPTAPGKAREQRKRRQQTQRKVQTANPTGRATSTNVTLAVARASSKAPSSTMSPRVPEGFEPLNLHVMKTGPNAAHFPRVGEPVHDECTCEFQDTCSCSAALMFIDCVSNACSSGKCECHPNQYLDSCEQMAGMCTNLHFQCSASGVKCTMEAAKVENVTAEETVEDILADLNDFKEQKCELERSARYGWLNADNRLRELMPVIEARMMDLLAKNHALPEMHCEKDFEEWWTPAPPAKEAEALAHGVVPSAVLGVALAAALLG